MKRTHISYRYRPEGCPKGRIGYPTEVAARAQLFRFRVLRAKGNVKRKESEWYRCRGCGWYHLSSWKVR